MTIFASIMIIFQGQMTSLYVGNDYILTPNENFYIGNDYILRPNDKFLRE